MVMFPVHQVWPKPSCKAQWKGEEGKADKGRVGRQHQGMDRPGVRQVPEGNGEQGKWRKLVVKSSVLLQRPLRLRDRWQWWWSTLKKASEIKDISETEKKNIFQTGDIDVHFYLTSIFPLSLLYSSFTFILETAWLSLLSPMADKHDCKASSFSSKP